MKPLCIILLPLLILFACQPLASAAEPPARWEYRLFPFKANLQSLTGKAGVDGSLQARRGDPVTPKLEEMLNKLGAEGWELCAESDGMFVFKRLKTS